MLLMSMYKIPNGQFGLTLADLAANAAYKSSKLVPKIATPTLLPKGKTNPFAIQSPWIPTPGVDTSLLASGNNTKLQPNEKNQILTERSTPNLRPLVDVANYLSENNSINRIRKTQLARKNLYQNAPSLSVRPIQDLSPEILAAQENALTQTRSEYAGSDPVLNTINKNIATAERGKMRTEQIAGRATNLTAERTRFDTETRANQAAAAETAAKNIDREQEFNDYRTGVNTAALEAKKKLNADFLSQVGMNMDTAAQFNLTEKAVENQNARQAFEDRISMAYMEPDEGKRSSMLDQIGIDYPNGYTASLLPNYYKAQAGGLRGSFIGSLMTRGLFGKKVPPTVTK